MTRQGWIIEWLWRHHVWISQSLTITVQSNLYCRRFIDFWCYASRVSMLLGLFMNFQKNLSPDFIFLFRQVFLKFKSWYSILFFIQYWRFILFFYPIKKTSRKRGSIKTDGERESWESVLSVRPFYDEDIDDASCKRMVSNWLLFNLWLLFWRETSVSNTETFLYPSILDLICKFSKFDKFHETILLLM